MTEIESNICPGEQVTLRFGSVDVETGEMFQIYRCESTGTYFTHPKPDDLDRYYSQHYREFHPLVERLFRMMYDRYARAVIKRVSHSGRMLEIGCGAGWMLEAFARQGWEATGFERTPEIARMASERTGLQVDSGSLDCIDSGGGYDIIMLYNVLEHLPGPDEAIDSCRALLKPGGSIVITLPNIRSWQAQLTRGHWFHLDVPRHLYHFTGKSLRDFLSRHGLITQPERNSSPALDLFGWVQSLQNLALPWPNGLHRLLSQPNLMWSVFSRKGMLIGGFTTILIIPAIMAMLMGWPLRRGAIIEVWAASPQESDTANS